MSYYGMALAVIREARAYIKRAELTMQEAEQLSMEIDLLDDLLITRLRKPS